MRTLTPRLTITITTVLSDGDGTSNIGAATLFAREKYP
jgi:hypothetical protein